MWTDDIEPTARAELVVRFMRIPLFAVEIPLWSHGSHSALSTVIVQHTFGRRLVENFGSDAIREISIEVNDAADDSFAEYAGGREVLVRRPTAFLPAHASPYDPSFFRSPFCDRSALVDTLYYPVPRLLDSLRSASSKQGYNTNEILGQAVDAFKDFSGLDPIQNGCNIGARSSYQLLPAFRFSLTENVTIQPIVPLRIPLANSCYRGYLCLRTNGILVFEAQAELDPSVGASFHIPKDKSPVDEIELRASVETPEGGVERLWEFNAPLIRLIQTQLGIMGTTTREVPSRYDSTGGKRQSALRPLI